MSLSDLPELRLFSEITDVSTNCDFFTYTKEQFNQTWSHFQSESSLDDSTSGLWKVATPRSSSSSSVLNTPERDAWDPNLHDASNRRDSAIEDIDMEEYLDCIALVAPLSPLPIDVVVPLTPDSDEWSQVSPLRGDEVLDEDSQTDFFPSSGFVDSLTTPSPSKSSSLNVKKSLRPPSPRSLKRKLFSKQSIQARRSSSNSLVSEAL